MMQRWSRKKPTDAPLIALLLFLFILTTILYNESYIQQIHQVRDNQPEQQVPITSEKLHSNISTATKRIAVNLDRFSTCSSTVKYGGKKAWQVGDIPEPRHRTETSEKCDMFSGKWVFDNTSYPLYDEAECPWMSDQLACRKHGRKDLQYQNWGWQPHDCILKRWNATDMWEKLRNKRLMYVGDSLNRGQWISMVCLLQSVIPSNKRSMSPNAPLTIFRAEEYNATVEFYWAPLLVESNSDDPVNHRLDDRIIRPDSVGRQAAEWANADILVFNSYLWWRQGPVKLLWSTEENGVCEELDGLGAMELAMKAWANWMASKFDPLKQRAFFVTMSPTHLCTNEVDNQTDWAVEEPITAPATQQLLKTLNAFDIISYNGERSREWMPDSEGNCYHETTPIETDGYWGSGSDLPTMRMVENVLSGLGSKVSILNITQLSEYRKDGHPSIYRKFWETLSTQQLSNPSRYSDCIHWCLPGVSDVWNELLYNSL